MTVTEVAPARTGSRDNALLATVLLGQFMAVLDVSIVNVAMPSIRVDLGAGGAALQLIVAGYTISYAVLLVTGARLGDRFGPGPSFRAGLAGFTAGSLLCGLAPSTGALIAFRLLQGAGAALMVPQVFSIIQRSFAGAARVRALGIYGAVIAGAATVGQALGGFLTGADILGTGWRPIFLVNVPVGVALLILGRRHLPSDRSDRSDRGERGRALDPVGVVTLGLAVFALVLPLVLGHGYGWPLWTWLSLAAGVALLVTFAIAQRHAAAPLISASVLRARGLIPAALAILAVMAAYGGFLFTLGLHTQGDLGYSPARAGLVLVPGAAAFGLSSLNWRRLPARWHRRMIPVSLLIVTVTFGLMALTLRDGRPIGPAYLAVTVLYGLALGAAFSPLLTFALAQVPAADAADASGVIATITQLAQVIGVATFGSLFLSLTGDAAAITDAAMAGACLLAAAFAFALPSRT